MASINTGSSPEIVPVHELEGINAEVRARTVFLQLARVLPAPTVIGRFKVPSLVSSPPDLSSSWLGEGEDKPIASIGFSRDELQMHKVASILYWTEELARDSYISLPAQLRAALTRAAAEAIDTACWSGSGGTDTDCLGLLTQSANFLSATFGDASDLGGDLAEMIRQLRHNNFEPSAFVMRSHVLHHLMLIEDSNARPKYPEARGPTPSFMGTPIVVSNNVGSLSGPNTDQQYVSDVVCAAWNFVEVYTAPGSIRISDVASLDDSGTTVNLWQQDMQAVRYVNFISDVRVVHNNAVAIMQNVEV